MNKAKNWFSNLSKAGRVSVITAATMGSLFVVSAASPSPQPQNLSTNTSVSNVKKEPVLTTKTETETAPIPFEKQTIESNELAKGISQIQTPGVNGIKTITYTINLKDGVETGRTSAEAVTTPPVTEVTVIGTYVKPASNCDPNYSGCVPIASDVDCAGGSGNGPAYTSGPVQVIGSDIYGLDRDGDGLGCE